ncbi:unnamed protein product [Durusdinium trenchii]|uniref:Uncharacterized protein n=1 Tax=Durusdinium trenchii TaxID=1381693 RepID=A0ABP0LUT4_9DINO
MGQQQSGTSTISEKTVKAFELLNLYQQLEEALAKPSAVVDVGEAYRQILVWCRAHPQCASVLEILSTEERYPAWRRQALEEAYRLFYDEAALWAAADLERLPEPPTSEEIGFRPLPETLVNGKAVEQKTYAGSFTDRSGFFRQTWHYEIHRISSSGVSGRRIVALSESRYVCAGDVSAKLLHTVLPDECCSAREDPAAAKGPFLLPKGVRGQRLPEVPTQEDPQPIKEPLHFEDHSVARPRARLTFPQPRG